MAKKQFASFCVALLSVSLLFAGCAGGAKESGSSDISEDADGQAAQVSSYTASAYGLNYSEADNWYLLPSAANSNGTSGDASAAIDVFIVYPTLTADTSKGIYILNQHDPMMDAGVQEFLEQSVHPVFDGLAVNIYMPRYRQYNGAGYYGVGFEEAVAAYAGLPRADIYNAYDYYLKHYNQGRDFVLFSHSQGSALAGFLLSDYTSRYLPESTAARMQIAYMTGWGLTAKVLENSPYPASKSPTDRGTIASWNCATPAEATGDYDRFTWGDATTVAVNPQTFSLQDGSRARIVRPADQGGSFAGQVVEVLEPLDSYSSESISQVMDGINLGYAHIYDITLFAPEIRANLQERLGL
jgi:hypothetical protein